MSSFAAKDDHLNSYCWAVSHTDSLPHAVAGPGWWPTVGLHGGCSADQVHSDASSSTRRGGPVKKMEK